MNVLMAAIKTKFTGSALATAVGSRFHLEEAPQEQSFPYVVCNLISNSPDYYLARERVEGFDVQFSLFSNTSGAAEIFQLFEHLKALYDNCVLTVTGYHPLMFRRTSAQLIREEEAKLWHYAITYEVEIE